MLYISCRHKIFRREREGALVLKMTVWTVTVKRDVRGSQLFDNKHTINNLNLTLSSFCSFSPAFEYLLPIAEQIGVILICFSKSHFSNSHLLLKINVLVWLKFKNLLRLLVLNVIFGFSFFKKVYFRFTVVSSEVQSSVSTSSILRSNISAEIFFPNGSLRNGLVGSSPSGSEWLSWNGLYSPLTSDSSGLSTI